MADVIGTRKFTCDLWGGAVGVASRIKSSGLPDKIQVASATCEPLKHKYSLEKRREVKVRGRAEMKAYWLSKS